MKPLIIIPARYASTRFPGKPLILIDGKPMIQHVYERCMQVTEKVVVATDDVRIEDAVRQFNGAVVQTSPEHQSGTDRCAEAARILSDQLEFDIVINVQGDEPFIQASQIQSLIDCFNDQQTQIATLITPITDSNFLFDVNKVKVVCAVNDFALYFSRAAIPFQRDVEIENWLKNFNYFLHIGIYGFQKEILQKVTQFESSSLEKMEKLEQLRWLENGMKIKTAITNHVNTGIDTPDDLSKLKKD